MSNRRTHVIVFFSAAIIMSLELVGSRIIAPHLGSSLVVWTALITVVLGSLAAGGWWGGKAADHNTSPAFLSRLLLLSSVYILIVAWAKEPLLTVIRNTMFDIRISALAATGAILAAPSFLLGAVLPYTVKLTFSSRQKLGRHVGNLYALSTIGSIVGTLATGFYLLSYLGNTLLLRGIGIALLLLALVNGSPFPTKHRLHNLWIFFFLICFLFTPPRPANWVEDADTQYGRVIILDHTDALTGVTARSMQVDLSIMSRVSIGSDTLIDNVYYFFQLGDYFAPGIDHALMLGGGGYVFPKNFLSVHERASIDVVEIDPKITQLAYKYFDLPRDPRLTIYHEDARTFLNKNTQTYDVIYSNLYNASGTIPFHTITKEAITQISNALNEDGVVLVNIVGPVEGTEGAFTRSAYHTYKSVFPNVLLFAHPRHSFLVAQKNPYTALPQSTNPTISRLLSMHYTAPIPADVPILTDDYAPVDQMFHGFVH